MWTCPSITSWLGTNGAGPCRKVWISLDNQGTSSPQLCCGCSGREEKEKQLFREAAGSAAHPHSSHSKTEHHLQLLPSAGICVSSTSQIRNSCASLLFSFLAGGDSTFIFQCMPCAPPALGWGLALGSAWHGRGDSLCARTRCWDQAELGGSESGITPTAPEVPQAGR